MLQSFCDGQIFAERIGEGPVRVVGLHGWARSRQDLIASLAGLSALALDLPGFGVSHEPPQAWGSDEYADLVAEMVAGLDGPQVVLGHSFGGRVAVKLAVRHPDLVTGVVLTGVPLIRRHLARTRSPMVFRAARWAHRHKVISDARMERYRQRYGSADYRNAAGVMRSILVRLVNESYEDDLRQIKCPVELVWGASDTAAPVQVAQNACEMIQDCRLTIIEGSGHMTPLSAADQLGQAIRRLLPAGAP